jgi:hypothetical protein
MKEGEKEEEKGSPLQKPLNMFCFANGLPALYGVIAHYE